MVFVGELINLDAVPAAEDENTDRFIAHYKVVKPVCGLFESDTISFFIMGFNYDSSFKKNPTKLIFLQKDSTEEDYHLWGAPQYDAFKTIDSQWAIPYNRNSELSYSEHSTIKALSIQFRSDAWFDVTDLSTEDRNILYPAPYYKYQNGRAIPLLGYTIADVFTLEKQGELATAGLFDPPKDSSRKQMVVQDVQLEEIRPENPDSVKAFKERRYKILKRALIKDPFNENRIQEFMESCRGKQYQARCIAYFNSFVKTYSDSASAYLLKAKYVHPKPNAKDTSKISVLLQAIRVDRNNCEANYQLAISYYRLFNLFPGRHYAYTARKWIMRVIAIDSTQFSSLKYPVIQLCNFLEDHATAAAYQNDRDRANADLHPGKTDAKLAWYLPFPLLLQNRDSARWVSDYKIDVMGEVKNIIHAINYFSRTMERFKEPVLMTNQSNKTVYRFLWDRSFDPTIIIRLEKERQNVTICWKIMQYNKDFDSSWPSLEFKKVLSLPQWTKFEQMLQEIDYWNMVPQDYHEIGCDGADWVLEGLANGKHKLTVRWSGNYPQYSACLKYLIALTDLHIPSDRMY